MKKASGVKLVAGILALSLLLVLSGCANASSTPTAGGYTVAKVTRGTLTVGIGAAGSLSAKQLATLTWKTSGTVDQVLVHPGQTVEANAELMTLAETSWDRTIKQAVAELDNAQKALDALLAGPDPQAVAQARLSYVQAKQAVPTAANRLRTALYYASRVLLDDYLEAWQAYVDAQEANVLTAEITQAYQDAKATWEVATLAGPNDDTIALTRAQFDVALAAYDKAKANLDTVLAGPTHAEILSAQARVEAAQATLDQARLLAPFRGTVLNVYLAPGDAVTPNTQALVLADLSAFSITVDVPEMDVVTLQIGQKAEVTFDALPDETFTGTVTQVGFVGNNQQGVVYYPVTVTLDKTDARFRPGMTAAVRIITQQRDNVLLVPNRAVRLANGTPYVILVLGDQNLQVPVTVGLSNETYTEIVSGEVREGDEVIITSGSSTNLTGGNAPAPGMGMGGLFGGRP